MRVCPKCGYEEHPMWRPRPSRGFVDYVSAETLEYIDPELFAKIRGAEPGPYFDGHFMYHITRGNVSVEKIEKSLYDVMGWGRDGEPEKVDRSPQTKLTDSRDRWDNL